MSSGILNSKRRAWPWAAILINLGCAALLVWISTWPAPWPTLAFCVLVFDFYGEKTVVRSR